VPGKSWENLSTDYRARLQRAGITKRDYESRSPELMAKRQAARGHKNTPEHPERAARNPDKFGIYIQTRNELEQSVLARKARLFKDRVRYNAGRSKLNVAKYRPTVPQMRRFLAANERDIDDFIESILVDGRLPDEWSFLGYH